MTRRRPPSQARSQATVDAVIEAAALVLAREGYARTTTNRIARVAGISIGSLYQYFPDKDALMATLVDRYLDEMWAVVDQAAPAGSMEIADVVRRLIAGSLRAHADHPALHRAVVELIPHVGNELRVEAAERRLALLVKAALLTRSDDVAPRDLDLAAILIVEAGMWLTYATMVQYPERLTDPATADELTALIVRYLTPAG